VKKTDNEKRLPRFLGSTKIDGVKRVSLVKGARDILGVEIGDYVQFSEINGLIVIGKAVCSDVVE